MITLKPGAIRELHWHPNANEWHYYLNGSARIGLFDSGGRGKVAQFQEISLADWMAASPSCLLANDFAQPKASLDKFPRESAIIRAAIQIVHRSHRER